MVSDSNVTEKTSTKEMQDEAWLGGKSDLWMIVQEIKIWSCWQMLYAPIRIRLRKGCIQNSMKLLDANGSPNPEQKTWSGVDNKKKNLSPFWPSGFYRPCRLKKVNETKQKR